MRKFVVLIILWCAVCANAKSKKCNSACLLKLIEKNGKDIQALQASKPSAFTWQSMSVASLEADGWQMVFRATSGNGQNTFQAWTQGQGATRSKPASMARSSEPHYRSPAVDNWQGLGVKSVKFAYYDHDREVAYVIFNGANSDLTNWFSKDRVTSSSYSDLKSTDSFNIFTIAGDLRSSLERRFFINRYYNGCDSDKGHFATIEKEGGCDWDKHPVYPQFLYSLINSVEIWNRRQFGRADYLAIFIKTS